MVPTFVMVIKVVVPSTVLSQVSTCTLDIAKNCTFENLFITHHVWSKDLYQTCNCTIPTVGFYGFISHVKNTDYRVGAFNIPYTPLRHNQGASALLISNTGNILTSSNLIKGVFLANSFFLICTIAQGILALIENQWDQVKVRNWAFCIIAGTTQKEQRATFGSRVRYYVGKAIAGFYFLAALAVVFICPFVFISSVIVNEFITWSFLVGEEIDAVGPVSTHD